MNCNKTNIASLCQALRIANIEFKSIVTHAQVKLIVDITNISAEDEQLLYDLGFNYIASNEMQLTINEKLSHTIL